ncbi:MAG: bifunctional folylpolyglutamate synthase/dihydrofolate synthase [Mariprofundaceae bacterium]
MDYRPGLERVKAVLSHFVLHKPQLRIRIAGTNGKGSVGYFLESALLSTGLRTGFYTSPHIFAFNERIRVNGQPVEDRKLFPKLREILKAGHEYRASPFELATALAIATFSQEKVDVEILECGLGARLDATTAVPADMALLTPVALDHQAWLGDTLTDIAAEKAYVFDGCRYCLSAEQTPEVREVIRCRSGNVTDISFVSAPEGSLKLLMRGAHQQRNAALALAAVQALQKEGVIQDISQAQQAIERTHIPGRLALIDHGTCHFWLDAAHNRHAVEALLPELKTLSPFDALFVFPRKDRDLRDVFPLLKPLCERLICALETDAVDAVYATIAEALDEECAEKNGNYLVLGSFLTVAAAENWLNLHKPRS